VVGLAAGAFLVFTQPAEPAPEIDPPQAQTAIYEGLAPLGYEAVLVDVTDESVLVRYEQPESRTVEGAYALARDTAALHANHTDEAVVQAYEDYEPTHAWTVPTDVVLAYLDGNATQAELDEATTEREH